MADQIFSVFSKICLIVVFGSVAAFLLHMIVGEFPQLKIPGLIVFILIFGAWIVKLLED